MTPDEYPFGTIVPSQQTPLFPQTRLYRDTPEGRAKKERAERRDGDEDDGTGTGTSGGSGDCPMCDICQATLTSKNALILCVDGSPILVNDYPAMGGPWIPAFQPNGQLVWINGGGL